MQNIHLHLSVIRSAYMAYTYLSLLKDLRILIPLPKLNKYCKSGVVNLKGTQSHSKNKS